MTHKAFDKARQARFERDVRETALTLIEERGETNALAWAEHCATRDPTGGFWRAVRLAIENWDDPR